MNKFAAEALTWLNTPFHINASLKGVGCDCYGLLTGVYKAVTGITTAKQPLMTDHRPKTIQHACDTFIRHSTLFCRPIDIDSMQMGDICAFRLGNHLFHAGIYVGDNTMIHADVDVVKQSRLNSGKFAGRLAASYRYLDADNN